MPTDSIVSSGRLRLEREATTALTGYGSICNLGCISRMRTKCLFFAALALLWVSCTDEPLPSVSEGPLEVVFVMPSIPMVEGEASTRDLPKWMASLP